MLRRRMFAQCTVAVCSTVRLASSTSSTPSHETAQTPPGFKAPPNIGPGRKPGQEANPYKSWEHLSHKWLLLMCLGCLAGGISAGQLAEVDETKLAPKFDRDSVIRDVMKHFEFRPDLAATALRVAFVLAARRAGVAALNIDESCAVVDGLDDIAGVFHYVANQYQMSMEDIASLTALAAVKFLKGPSMEGQWQWGREDAETAPPRKDSLIDPKAAKPQSSGGTMFNLADILKAVGCVSEAEAVALLGGCHSVGEFHEHVSGLEGAAHLPGANYTLDNRYFQFLLSQEKNYKSFEVAKTEENKALKHLPTNMRCVYAAAADNKKKKKSMCVADQRELDLLLKTPAYRKWVEVFAKDKSQFEEHFCSAFMHMIDSNAKRLRPLPAKQGSGVGEGAAPATA